MDNRCYRLKPSWVALVFQFSIFVILMSVMYQLLPLWLWGICIVLGLITYQLFYRKNPQIAQFEHLDGREWSITTKDQQTARASISHVIDHQAYVVVYFQHARMRPLLIWCDQLPQKQWKSLKVLTKML